MRSDPPLHITRSDKLTARLDHSFCTRSNPFQPFSSLFSTNPFGPFTGFGLSLDSMDPLADRRDWMNRFDPDDFDHPL